MNSKVSILIPAYGQPSALRKALQSVFQQNYTNFEVIVTDDTEDDSNVVVIQEFNQHPNLRYFKNTPPLGAPCNWNAGLSYATGEYIKDLHHDDWFHGPDALAKFVALLDANPNADFAFCGSLNCRPDGTLLYTHRANRHQLSVLQRDPYCLLWGNFIGAPSATIYRKKAAVLYDTRIKWCVDIDLYIRMLLQNPTFAATTEPLVGVTVESSQQLTRQYENNRAGNIFEYTYLYQKYFQGTHGPKRAFYRLWQLLGHYRVYNQQDFLDSGLTTNEIHPDLKSIIKYRDIHDKVDYFLHRALRFFSIYTWARFFVKKWAFYQTARTARNASSQMANRSGLR